MLSSESRKVMGPAFPLIVVSHVAPDPVVEFLVFGILKTLLVLGARKVTA